MLLRKDCLMSRIGCFKFGNFVIGISCFNNFIYKPCISECIPIYNWRNLFINNYIFGVQHAEDRMIPDSRRGLFQSFCSLEFSGNSHHLRSYAIFNYILVALEFYRAVSADCLMMITYISVVKSIYTQVEDSVIGLFVLQNNLVYRPFRKHGGKLSLGDER